MKPSRRRPATEWSPSDAASQLEDALNPPPCISSILARSADQSLLNDVARNLLTYAALVESQGSHAFARRLVARASDLMEAAVEKQRRVA